MAWTTPHTAVANGTLTSANYNLTVRDNFLQMETAKAQNQGGYFVSTAVNAIAERQFKSASILTTQTTSSTSYANLATAGPSVTVTTGTTAIVWIGSQMGQSLADNQASISCEVSGASTVAASDDWRVSIDGIPADSECRYGAAHRFTGLTSGSNTFQMKYKVNAGTGTFKNREIMVMPL